MEVFDGWIGFPSCFSAGCSAGCVFGCQFAWLAGGVGVQKRFFLIFLRFCGRRGAAREHDSCFATVHGKSER